MSLYDREIEEIREALALTAPCKGSHDWAGLESPDVRGRVRAAATWMERAALSLKEEHPMSLKGVRRRGQRPIAKAVEAVQATSAEGKDGGWYLGRPQGEKRPATSLVEEVDRHLAARRRLEEVLRAELDERELYRLLEVLVDMHTDPLDQQPAEAFLDYVERPDK